jgi:hypothetical protein
MTRARITTRIPTPRRTKIGVCSATNADDRFATATSSDTCPREGNGRHGHAYAGHRLVADGIVRSERRERQMQSSGPAELAIGPGSRARLRYSGFLVVVTWPFPSGLQRRSAPAALHALSRAVCMRLSLSRERARSRHCRWATAAPHVRRHDRVSARWAGQACADDVGTC